MQPYAIDVELSIRGILRGFGLKVGEVTRKPPDIRSYGYAATLDEAKAQFETAWRQWLAWAKLLEEDG
jgi:hypothetical protein